MNKDVRAIYKNRLDSEHYNKYPNIEKIWDEIIENELIIWIQCINHTKPDKVRRAK